MSHLYKLPLLLEPQPEGGYTVTSPLVPELVTEGDTVEECLANVRDALAVVLEIYRDRGQALPASLLQSDGPGPVWVETLVATA
jgi:antitoxin HicB